MGAVALLHEAQAAGLEVRVEGDRLIVRGPRSAEALAQRVLAHKPDILLELTSVPRTPPPPCARCGASEWRETPDAGRWCAACVLAGREPVAAVKVHSAALDTEVWVVADDLPQERWPQDAPVYTHAEVMILVQAGPDILEWMHAVKTMFNGKVVQGHRKGEPHG